ncbi:TPA: phospholipase C accessory protein PlcR [Pseudomonas aeruginosa]|uniref:phospholipase C accessory protein PlcR n=1 Tax=Pseudomonas aeruginosa TaxID=287 RepID=UPI00053D4725|nr:phospholipase C accessory protein PlcR [Pseudomonas aeruginosa]MBG6342896.1 phospholipase C accessory protein PlcR [Pseudomonas aeruginosa]MBG7167711.1 phospholipase C accessory protein PlcR [Pseudomonas aeruginosa]MBH8783703.1 phospholipase C accessory protein PlcR [Pseudomonas aeruginosa]MBI8781848.1 phospholipase C accessory protein PlcR [Pseudomonas aeruginosa]MBI8895424.1 phospholipase C accessory protein PlcR [Pseudomonas aeruginosa]
MRPTLTWTLLALLLCGTAIGAVLLFYPSEPAPVAPFASPPQATPAAKPSIPSRAPEMNTATAPDNLEQQLGEFGRNAGQMSEIERKQAAEGLIEQLKREVAVGADPRQTFEEIQRLTPYVETDARRREALDFEIWMALKDNASVQQQAPTPGEEEQLREYAQESDKVIAEVLASVDGEEQRHAAIDERLKALRKQIFGEENPRLLQR